MKMEMLDNVNTVHLEIPVCSGQEAGKNRTGRVWWGGGGISRGGGGGQRRPRGHLVHCEQLKILLWPNVGPRGPTRPRGTMRTNSPTQDH